MRQFRLKSNLIFLLFWITPGITPAQQVGYVDVEMLLWFMPGYLAINDTLSVQQAAYQSRLQVRQQYAQSLLEEYYSGKAVMRPDQLQIMENRLAALNSEIDSLVQDAEWRLEYRRQSLIRPFLQKIDSVARLISEAQQYRYILNHSNSGQVSNILFGPEQHNLMPDFARRLGFPLPPDYLEVYRNRPKD